ncbi:MAG: VWA domain-containing protein, partial [Acidobacteriota bacterium]
QMNIDPRDPRLTAYALDELENEQERGEIEKALAHSEVLRREVEEIRKTAALVTIELEREPSVGLSPEQQERFESELPASSSPSILPLRAKWGMAGGLAAAACVIFAIIISSPNLYRSSTDLRSLSDLSSPAADAPVSEVSEVGRQPGDERAVETEEENRESVPAENSRQFAGQTAMGNESFRKNEGEKGDAVASQFAELDDSEPLKSKVSPVERDNLMVGGSLGRAQQATRGAGEPMSRRAREAGNQTTAPAEMLALVAPAPGRTPRSHSEASTTALPDSRPVDVAGPVFSREGYDQIRDNPFLSVSENPLSTFSIDVDTASYSNVRRFLNSRNLPPRDAVRIEEMINYFSYDYPDPEGDQPFSVHAEIAQAPWQPRHRLLKVGLKGREMAWEERPSSNLVFLLDVSGSMQPDNKLPLLKSAFRLLLERLGENDRVAMVVYAGASGLVLPSTSADQKQPILAALDRLKAGGSTHGSSGIQLAYETAIAHLIPGGINRVILATDGDFNVGLTDQGSLTRLIEEKARSGVFLSVLGFGMGNYQDSTLEKLADQGNGNYAYIDTLQEARKVLVEEIHSTLMTLAKDVKIQIEFNPLQVEAYRLVGYENRLLAKEDFNDDTKDAGEIGAGHTVTALYEIVPAGQQVEAGSVDALRYQRRFDTTEQAATGEMLTLKLRYKDPEEDHSELLESVVRDSGREYARASQDFKFAAAVASFGMLLRESPHQGTTTLESILELGEEGRGTDANGYRSEFLDLVRKARSLIGPDPARE